MELRWLDCVTLMENRHEEFRVAWGLHDDVDVRHIVTVQNDPFASPGR